MYDTNARFRQMVCSPQIKMQKLHLQFCLLHLGIRKYLNSYYILDTYFFFTRGLFSSTFVLTRIRKH